MTRVYTILILFAVGVLSCSSPSTSETAPSSAAQNDSDVVTAFDELDIKPRFGGCNDITDPVELKSCADKKMAQFINNNLKYPETARSKKIEGKAVVSFVIEPNGSLSDIKALSTLGGGLEEEAVRVFKLMNEQKKWWVAGMKDGKRQRVKLQLPINFKM